MLSRSSAKTAKNLTRSLRTFATGKDIQFGVEARRKMLDGVERLASAVTVTLGPKGRNVIIEQSYGAPKITKDGVTVAKAIEFSDPYENLGAQLVRQVANKTNDTAGDGTTTATVLANAIFSEGFKSVVQGTSPVEIKRGIDIAVKEVIQGIAELSRDVGDEEIQQVATISANGDANIGNLISEAMQKVGRKGVIDIADGRTLDTEVEIVEGLSFDRGFISPYFSTNTKTQKVEFDSCLVLVCTKKISTLSSVLPFLNACAQSGTPLLIIADDVDGEALMSLVVNKLNGRLKVAAVKAPGFGDNKMNTLRDIAIFTGAKEINEESGTTMENIQNPTEYLGKATKVTITKDRTILINNDPPKDALQERLDLIQNQIQTTDSTYEKEKLAERYGKLSGGVAVIRVGGGSDVEVGEKKDRVVDALNATRAAVDDGIVPGGGSALLYSSRRLNSLLQDQTLSEDEKIGVRIVREAVRKPNKMIANNAGTNGDVITYKLLERDDTNIGYNADKDEFVNMFEAGIVDPTKVVKTALQDASSVAGMLLTAEAAITNLPTPPPPAGGGGAPGMGGMDF